MKKPLRQTVVAFAVIAALTTGCRSTDEYKKLANAGSQYTNAIDKLLDAASNIRIDTTSEQLLRNDRILNLTIEDYKKVTQSDEDRLVVTEKLRKHNKLLGNYFRLLNELASSDAPTRAQGEIAGVVDNLNKIGKELQGSDLITNPGLFQGITNLVVSSQIRGALRDELEKRNRTILLELTIQKEMLKALGDSIGQDVKLIRIAREERFVIRPLIQDTAISDADTWIETRRKLLTMEARGKELNEASKALGNFQEVFQAFVEGKLSLAQLNAFLQDVDALLKLVEMDKS
jgi:bifunctional DNA-binding transcriptional regulator/antitoxin component of YhaV-PrlF toxin-antitoxin module